MNNFLESMRNMPPQPHYISMDPNISRHQDVMGEQKTQTRLAKETRDLAEQSAEFAARQTELLAAMNRLSEELAQERRDSAAREAGQQTFNKRMSWTAVALAGAAAVLPFVVLWLDKVIK